MGKGDKKSKRGKIIKGTYGVRRKRKSGLHLTAAPVREESTTATVAAEAQAAPEKKTTKTTTKKPAAKSTAKTTAKTTEKKPAKPASKATKTETGKVEK